MISIHAPANGATFINRVLDLFITDFNPRSGERSDRAIGLHCCITTISIHAPANGATVTEGDSLAEAIISIHAPANGATKPSPSNCTLGKFQSTLRRTERQYLDDLFCAVYYFNPRSGERSDCYPPLTLHSQTHFNPRSGERSDSTILLSTCALFSFQSTLRRTERPECGQVESAINYFNPRSGERSDKRPTN